MKRRQTMPRQWLIADTRADNQLEQSIGRLPRGSGVLILFHDLPRGERERLLRRIRRQVTTKALLVIDETGSAARVHNLPEMRRALLARTPMVLLSPLYPTLSHTDRRPIPRMRAAAYARLAGRRLIALGGMDERRFRRRSRLGFIGWAGISAFRT